MERSKSLRWLPSSSCVCVYEGGIRFFFLISDIKTNSYKRKKELVKVPAPFDYVGSDQPKGKGWPYHPPML
jgi:hypothetical protein